MNRVNILVLIVGLLTVGMFARVTHAQAVYGSISGTVTDASGAVVPGATVTITSVERQTSVQVTSNESGLYSRERLLPGTYDVNVEAANFKKAVLSGVVVNVDASTNLDVSLEAGAITETVTVTAASGETLKTDRADVATTLETKQLTDLPVLDRNFTKFILLTPGTTLLGWNHAASENPQGSTQTFVNGQHFSGTGYQLDGTENRDPILGIIVVNPNLESIGEAKITSQNYDAEFGQAIAGVVSVQTKSGTNEFHGTVFEFRQNDVLQARNPFSQFQADPLTGKFVPDTLRNQFGGAIGGPIIKNKVFFFFDYQGTRSKIGGTKLLSVPTLAARAGDLSAYGVNIYEPGTTNQFPGNRIPAGQLSPQALAILNLIPTPNAPGRNGGIADNYVASGSEGFDNDTFDVRGDATISDHLNLFGRYSFADYRLDGPTAFGQGGGPELVSLGGNSNTRNQSIAMGFDYTLNDTTILDFRFGWFRYHVNVLPFDFGKTTASDVGVPGLNLDDFSSGLFAGFIKGAGALGDINFGSGLGVNRCNCPLEEDESQYQFVTNVSKLIGNHTVKFGVDVRRAFNLRVPSDRHRSGELTFDTGRTSNVDTGEGGSGLATFLLGDVTHFTRFSSTSTNARERQWRHFYYGQDTWRVTPKLTVAYGLRLDVINPQTVNEAGNGGFLDQNTGEIKVAGVGGIGLNGDVENSWNFAPRLGVAYQWTDRTVIRVGYGRSYDIGVFGSVFGHSVTQNLPVLAAQEFNRADNFSRVFTLAEGPSAPVFPTPDASGRFPLPNGIFARLLLDKQTLPAVDAWNATFQHQLTDTISYEVAYVGNKGTHVFAGGGPTFNVNQPAIDPNFRNGQAAVPSDLRKPFFAPFGWTQGIDYFCNCSDNHYNALQTKITKRYSDGWSLLAHYTFQRATNYDGDYFFPDRKVNYGRQDVDRTHVFVVTETYDLPFGHGKKFGSDVHKAVDYAIGGWQFNSNTTIESGVPFNVGYTKSGQDRDTGPGRPDLIGDPNAGGDRNQWFNTTPIGASGSAFGRPAPGTFGNLERNSIDGPGFWRTDASLFKKFDLTERVNLEFRIEVVNLFNHVNLGQPDSNLGTLADPNVPGDTDQLNGNAGRITGTAFGDSMRNFQWALKLSF